MRIKDYEDYDISIDGIITSFKYNKEKVRKTSISKSGYDMIVLNKNNKKVLKSIHTLVWDHFGTSERNGRTLQVDHIDGNKRNNHIDNLQLLTQRENSVKYRKSVKNKTTSKYVGVCWRKDVEKWTSQITINKKQLHLGYFDDEYEAYLIYKKKLENG